MTAGAGEADLALLERDLRAQGGLLGGAVRPPGSERAGADGSHDPGLGALAAAGPRAAGREKEYELLVELIREGYLLHYGSSRALLCEDPDLELLAGDQLYALGLIRLAGLGDLDAVSELADVISLTAQAHAAGDPALAEAVWRAGATAVGWGASAAHWAAKESARAGEPDARERLDAVNPPGEVGDVARGR